MRKGILKPLNDSSSFFRNVPVHIILIIFLFIQIFPLYFLLINVFKTNMEFATSQLAFPESFNFQNLIDAWVKGDFLNAFKNTLIITVGGTFGRIFFGSLAAYALAILKFRGQRFLYYLILGCMFLPPIVVLFPLFRLMGSLGLLNTYFAPIIAYIGYLPFTTFIFVEFFKNIPKDIIDAARIDGCSNFGIYYSIVLKMSKPVLSTLVVINARYIWSDFMFPLILLNQEDKFTLMLRILNFKGRFTSEIPLVISGVFISIIPILVLLFIFQKNFTKGITLGSYR